MHNWSTDTTQLKKKSAKYKLWKLEQQVNFGLDNAKISRKDLKKDWDNITIDPARRRFLNLILWPNKKLAKDLRDAKTGSGVKTYKSNKALFESLLKSR